ncbi:MAG TPA: cupin domain-containing protein [Spirochaetales bacterium]|nr:cupin domain-containing protein [Spirochaetales bacterium]
MVVKNLEVPAKALFDGASRKILARGGGLMAVEARFAKGTSIDEHAHPHEQVSYVVSGRLVVTLGGREETLGPGDSFYAGPGMPHAVRFLEDSVVTDTFTPQRDDFL